MEKTKIKKTKITKKNKLKKIIIIFLLVLLFIIITIGSVLTYVYVKNKDKISITINHGYQQVKNIDNNTFNSRHNTQLLDKDGKLLKEFKVANYIYKPYPEINENVFKSFISIEDERFYKHKGIDFKSILRAGTKVVLNKGKPVQGGSTITQQLVKNVFLTNDKTMWRKLEEMVIAQELEEMYSKEQILEFYVNNIYFGYGCYGIETASDYFFQKDTKHLTLAEIAFLISIPNNPTRFDPIKNINNTNNRKNIILNKMFELKKITNDELQNELNRSIILNKKQVFFDNTLYQNDQEYAIQKATEYLMNTNGFQFKYKFKDNKERTDYFINYQDEYSKNRTELINGGYIINTSIDSIKQNKLQELIDSELKNFTEKQPNGLFMRQSSATIIDNKTGEVVAIVGGRTQKNNNFNRASLGARQPGSTFKPLISYTPAFENGYFPEFIMEDKKIEKGPLNWYSGYKGNVPLRYATEISLNTIPYRLTSEVGMDIVLNKLKDMKFRYLTPEDNNPIISVGGMTRGTTTLEVSGAYSTLARNGEFIDPTNIRKIVKIGSNKTIYENIYSKKRIYDEGASYLMTDVLKGTLLKSHGTGYKARMNNWKNQAGKTGSTDENKDLWMTGYTPYYTTTVWVGDDIPNSISSGYYAPKNIWKNTMDYLHKDLKDIPFDKPSNIYNDNGYLKALISKENKLIIKQREIEEKRKKDETDKQNLNLNLPEYTTTYNISNEEELLREQLVDKSIMFLENYNYNSLTQDIELKDIILRAKNAINDIKEESVYNMYLNRFNDIVYKFELQRQLLNQKKETEINVMPEDANNLIQS